MLLRMSSVLVLLTFGSLLTSAGPTAMDEALRSRVEANVLGSPRRVKRLADKTKKSLIQEDRTAFVEAHNEARSIVDPPAPGMPFMSWNTTLEAMGQAWALHCTFAHGQPKEFPKLRLGQNIWVGTGGYNPGGAVRAWDKEKRNYNLETLGCTKVCGHYTQVVWEKSTEVGCGIAYCDKIKSFGDNAGYLVVCNYQPPGNYRGTPPYTAGKSCKKCPKGYSKCKDNLCRKDPLCGELKCAGGETMNTTTCLCKCDGEKGAYCQGSSVGLVPCLQLLGVVLLQHLFQ